MQTFIKHLLEPIESDWLEQVSFLYLILPFVIFCITWIKFPFGLIITAIFIWLCWRYNLKTKINLNRHSFSIHKTWLGLIILAIWVYFSGIGGFAFQNYDHHIRNAIFRDLIDYQWPVIYNTPGNGNQDFLMVYYIGFWLPSALIGKLFGYTAANISLFLWTWLGVSLITMQICKRLHWPLIFSALLLITFSGMDVVGTIIENRSYPTLWPPTQHLEWWAKQMQYSSFTTQLFWVFNQAIPGLLCIALLMNRKSKTQILLIWSLCFFFAPLPAIGLFPLAFLAIVEPSGDIVSTLSFKNRSALTRSVKIYALDLTKNISPENIIGGGIVLVVSLLYYSINRNSSSYGLFTLDQISFSKYIIFVLLEGAFLWFLLLFKSKKKVEWIIVGCMLLFFPWVKVGSSIDFCLRASIPALFYLMIGVGEGLTQKSRILTSILVIFLILGAWTPLYEINRSIYRTASYYWHEFKNPSTPDELTNVNLEMLYQPYKPEKDHPHSLTANYVSSLSVLDFETISNFVANPKNSLFYNYFIKPQ